jgi:hypothetical protein
MDTVPVRVNLLKPVRRLINSVPPTAVMAIFETLCISVGFLAYAKFSRVLTIAGQTELCPFAGPVVNAFKELMFNQVTIIKPKAVPTSGRGYLVPCTVQAEASMR